MNTILSANIPHYLFTAQALERAGYLKRYICAIGLKSKHPLLHFLPKLWQKKLEGREINGVPPEKTVTLWFPELLAKGLPRTSLISPERGNWLNNHLYDWMATTRYVDECDIFHFVSSVGLYSARKAKALGATLICDVRQEHPNFQKRILQEEGEKFGINNHMPGELYEEKVREEFAIADYLIVPSSYAKETFVIEGFEGNRIFVLPYGVDFTYLHRAKRGDSIFRILFVGQITLRKGIQYLLQALHELRLPRAELLLIGQIDPAMEPLLKKYQGLFRHIPSVPKVELFRYYSNASVFVLPSLADSFALVVLEAMACGLPVIVSEHTGSKEVLTDGLDSFIVPIRDVEALKEKILYFYQHPDVREEMGAAALSRVQTLTWDLYGERAVEIYRSIGQRRGLPS